MITVTTGDEPDFARGARFVELKTEEMFGHKPQRPRWNRENEPGQEVREVERDNVRAVERESHRFDNQNY